MRYRYLVPLGGLCVVVPAVCFFLPRAFSGSPSEDSLGPFDDWSPTPQAIRQEVGPGSGGSYSDERHRKFATIFQKRFRSHDKAIGVRFTSNNRIKLMCAALIPRWDMAQVGVQLHREAEDIFGKSYTIDVFETYISMQQRKLAEIRKEPNSEKVEVHFDPSYAEASTHNRPWIWFMLRARIEPSMYVDPRNWGFLQQMSPSPTSRPPAGFSVRRQ
jgi:hypothetical protein